MNRFLLALLALVLAAPPAAALTDNQLLDEVQEKAFWYFWYEANPANGLIKDRSTPGSPCSIAANGFGFSALCIGIDHGWITRAQGRQRVLTALNTFWNGPQGTAETGTIGYKGLFYHFLDMNTATRTWSCELSTIDTALLLAGILDAQQYFDGPDADEVQIRALADSIYRRVDWEFVRNFGAGIRLGWKPTGGFSGYGTWVGYNEAMIMYLLALGSPTHPNPASVWNTWTSGYSWQNWYGYEYVNFPPLFGHQYSHCWVDFRLTNDAYMTNKGITYFENSRRATLANRQYCIINMWGYTGYGPNLWGLTASDDPLVGYQAHGAPPSQNDNGTLTPTAPVSSIPFAPEVVLPTMHNMYDNYPALWGLYGFLDAFNPHRNWYDTDFLGIDQGPMVIMIENYRTGKVWNRMMANPYILAGLANAGFNAVTAVEPGAGVVGIDLAAAQPNPFMGRTTMRFTLPAAAYVRLAAYDAAGRRVAQLADGGYSAGTHSVVFDGSALAPGVYQCVLEAAGNRAVRQVVRLR